MPKDEYSSLGINYFHYENSRVDFFMETSLRHHTSKTKNCSKNRNPNLQTRHGTKDWENVTAITVEKIKTQPNAPL